MADRTHVSTFILKDVLLKRTCPIIGVAGTDIECPAHPHSARAYEKSFSPPTSGLGRVTPSFLVPTGTKIGRFGRDSLIREVRSTLTPPKRSQHGISVSDWSRPVYHPLTTLDRTLPSPRELDGNLLTLTPSYVGRNIY